MQLVAGEFDGEDVVRVVAFLHHVDDRGADVADGGGTQARGRRIEASIWVVVVLPLVPVIASQGAASGPRSRQAISTSPTTSTPASAAAAKSGLNSASSRAR